MMFTEHAFLDRFAAAADAGFQAVEFLFPFDYEIEVLEERLQRNTLTLALFNLYPGDWAQGGRGLTALQGQEKAFQEALSQALEYASALGCRQLHAMAGLEAQGAGRARYVANLKYACACAAPKGIDILIEPINRQDMPGYFLERTDEAVAVINDVGCDNIGLQFDLYHRHKSEGGVANAIAQYVAYARHYQCAAPRDRGEPDQVDMDYKDIFQRIDASGYSGWIGCEYRPRGRTQDGLKWRQDLLV